MNSFIKPKSGFVYHCIPVEPVGDCIQPSIRCGGLLTKKERRRLKVQFQEKTPLIFAGTHITKSMAFGLQGSLQEKILNCSIHESDEELVLACDREKMLSRERNITIYELPDEGFVTVDGKERQVISVNPIPFHMAKIAYQAKNAEDLMRGGLQIIAFKETYKELLNDGTIDLIDTLNDNAFFMFVGDMVRMGKLVWENRESNISPSHILSKKINISLKRGQQSLPYDRNTLKR